MLEDSKSTDGPVERDYRDSVSKGKLFLRDINTTHPSSTLFVELTRGFATATGYNSQ
jgi:hypothetical protein